MTPDGQDQRRYEQCGGDKRMAPDGAGLDGIPSAALSFEGIDPARHRLVR
jgi:hypothetical protein